MSKFSDKILEISNLIPKGKVASYGQIALFSGVPRGAQAVGWVLHQHGDKVPWWRVINNQGRISTRCIEHHASLQKKHLEEEGVEVTDELNIDIEKYRWRPSPETIDKLSLEDEVVFKIMEKYSI